MNKVLFINACLRRESRTLKIADAVISNINRTIQKIDLYKENIYPLNNHNLMLREKGALNNDFSDDYFIYAKDFKSADTIVIAAPYWDLSFPAILKTYFENICISGLTFTYDNEGKIISLCNAQKLIYITTAGGFILEKNYAFDYVDALAKNFFNIKDTVFIKAEALDIYPEKVDEILDDVIKNIKSMI